MSTAVNHFTLSPTGSAGASVGFARHRPALHYELSTTHAGLFGVNADTGEPFVANPGAVNPATGNYTFDIIAKTGSTEVDRRTVHIRNVSDVPTSPYQIFLGGGQVVIADPSSSAIRDYFDAQHAANDATQMALAADGTYTEGQTYYLANYALGLFHMFIATADVSYLERLYDYLEASMADATVVDNSGNLNWPGVGANALTPNTPDGPQSETLLFSIQAGIVFAQAAAIGLLNSGLIGSTNAARAQALYEFARDNIADKWYVDRGYTGELNRLDAASSAGGKDRSAMAGVVLMALNAVESNPTYEAWISNIMQGWKDRLITSASGKYMDPSPDSASYDTAHSNRWAMLGAASILWDAPNKATLTQCQEMGDHFAGVIYNGNAADVEYAAYQDGTGSPSGLSGTYFGWHWLGFASPDAQQASLEAVEGLMDSQVITGNSVWSAEGAITAAYLANEVLSQLA